MGGGPLHWNSPGGGNEWLRLYRHRRGQKFLIRHDEHEVASSIWPKTRWMHPGARRLL